MVGGVVSLSTSHIALGAVNILRNVLYNNNRDGFPFHLYLNGYYFVRLLVGIHRFETGSLHYLRIGPFVASLLLTLSPLSLLSLYIVNILMTK